MDSSHSSSRNKEAPPVTASESTAAVLPPPDGGWEAWSQTIVAHLVQFNSWGYINSFGFFQNYYGTTLGVSASAISWVGSLQIFLVFFIGTFSGRATDAGYYRTVLLIGSLLQLLGVFMTSIATQYWQLLLAQGICVGIGDGLVFCPTIALLASYFAKKRAIAIAISAAGAGTGGIVFPLIARQMLDQVGFGWTIRTMGFVMLFNVTVIMSLARTRLAPRRTGPLVDWAAFRSAPYSLFCAGMFFNYWAIFFAFYYLPTFGKTVINLSTSDALVLLLVMNAIGIPARMIFALISDFLTGPVRALIATTFLSGILLYAWSSVTSTGGLYAFSVIYGIFAAGVQSLFPAACAGLTEDLSKVGVRVGMVFSVVSVACLTGPPLSGALIGIGDGRFLYAQMFGGTAFMLGAASLVAGYMAKKRGEAS